MIITAYSAASIQLHLYAESARLSRIHDVANKYTHIAVYHRLKEESAFPRRNVITMDSPFASAYSVVFFMTAVAQHNRFRWNLKRAEVVHAPSNQNFKCQ